MSVARCSRLILLRAQLGNNSVQPWLHVKIICGGLIPSNAPALPKTN